MVVPVSTLKRAVLKFQLDLDLSLAGIRSSPAPDRSTCALAEVFRLYRPDTTRLLPWPLQFRLESSSDHGLGRELRLGNTCCFCDFRACILSMGKTHGPESTDTDRSLAKDFTSRVPFALARVDELWRLLILHRQLVSLSCPA